MAAVNLNMPMTALLSALFCIFYIINFKKNVVTVLLYSKKNYKTR